MTDNEQDKIKRILEKAGTNSRRGGIPGVTVLKPALTFRRQSGAPITVGSVCVSGEFEGKVHDGTEWLSADFIDSKSIDE